MAAGSGGLLNNSVSICTYKSCIGSLWGQMSRILNYTFIIHKHEFPCQCRSWHWKAFCWGKNLTHFWDFDTKNADVYKIDQIFFQNLTQCVCMLFKNDLCAQNCSRGLIIFYLRRAMVIISWRNSSQIMMGGGLIFGLPKIFLKKTSLGTIWLRPENQ